MRLRARAGRARALAKSAWFQRRYDWAREGHLRDGPALILIYNGVWGAPDADLPAGTLPPGFEITTDRSRMRDAAAVVFHTPSLGSIERMRKFPGQLWVAGSMECAANHPRLADPAFMSQFDLTMAYHRGSDVVTLYCGAWLEHLLGPVRAKTAASPAALFVSAHHDHSGRTEYARELMKHVRVDSFGRRLRNAQLVGPDRGRKTKLETIARYPFTLAFENAIAEDYVTEKFFDPLVAGSVPVYLGARNVSDFAPGERCYVDVADFAGPVDLARHLRELAADESAYAEYHAWRRRPLRQQFTDLVEAQRRHPLARLCDVIA